MAWNDQYDAQYNALQAQLAQAQSGIMGNPQAVTARIMADMSRVVQARDAAAAQIAQTNEQWHKNYQAQQANNNNNNGAADAARQAAETAAREAAGAFLKNILTQYGMSSLAGQVDSLVRQWGTNSDVIALKLKDTTEYKDRFKGLLALQSKNITDVRNEAQYIQLETDYRQVFRESGIQSFLGAAGSAAERDSIADLVGNYTVSVDEVRSRVQDAQRVVADTAPEVRDALQRFYNVSAADLVAYTLDPARTKNRINDIANAAIVGGYAQRSGLTADLGTAEQIGGLAQGNDISVQNITAQMTNAAGTKDSTGRLADIEKSTLSDSEILQSEFDLNDQSKKKIKGLQSRERARFSGSSAITASTLSTNRGI